MVYPNPSEDNFDIEVENLTENSSLFRVMIHSGYGAEVYDEELIVTGNGTETFSADLGSQNTGYYYLSVIYNNVVIEQRVLVKI